jgi:hypothetical protein
MFLFCEDFLKFCFGHVLLLSDVKFQIFYCVVLCMQFMCKLSFLVKEISLCCLNVFDSFLFL